MSNRMNTPVMPAEQGRAGVDYGKNDQSVYNTAKKWRIPGDLVAKVTADLPDFEREQIKWFAGHCRDKNYSHSEAAQLLKKNGGGRYSESSVYYMFTGRRDEGSMKAMAEAIKEYRDTLEARAGLVESGFIETILTRKIWAVCRRSFLRQKLSFIFGESQIGKTTALMEYQRNHNHGETVYVRVPTRGSYADFLEEMSVTMGIPHRQRTKDLKRRIIDSFDDRMLLIVDECHQCFWGGYASTSSLATLDFCREIHDRKSCGVVLCGTNVLRDGIIKGPQRQMLRQLWLRAYTPLQLPSVPNRRTLDEFAAAYGLPPAPDKKLKVEVLGQDGEEFLHGNPLELQTRVIQDHGLGRWLSILIEASDMANESEDKIKWAHAIKAHCSFKAMENVED